MFNSSGLRHLLFSRVMVLCQCSHDPSPPRQADYLEVAVGSTLWTSFVSMDPFRSYHMINRFEIASKEVLGIDITSPRKWWAKSPLVPFQRLLEHVGLPCLASPQHSSHGTWVATDTVVQRTTLFLATSKLKYPKPLRLSGSALVY